MCYRHLQSVLCYKRHFICHTSPSINVCLGHPRVPNLSSVQLPILYVCMSLCLCLCVCVCVCVSWQDDTAIFYPEFVLKQLQQFKILDAALIQSCGFPIRIKHSIFLQNYNSLFVDAKITEVSAREKCERILQAAHIKDYHVGLTMVGSCGSCRCYWSMIDRLAVAANIP